MEQTNSNSQVHILMYDLERLKNINSAGEELGVERMGVDVAVHAGIKAFENTKRIFDLKLSSDPLLNKKGLQIKIIRFGGDEMVLMISSKEGFLDR